jgi:septal ring factor EnvC (AmiA/AmiB activator)
MTEQTIATIVVAAVAVIPPTLVALAGFKQSQKNGDKADEIHVLVDGNMSKVQADLAEAKTEIADLRKVIIEMAASRKEGSAL